MGSAMHIRTRVLKGKRIEVSAGDLTEGQAVDVFVIVPGRAVKHRSVLEMLRSTPAPGVFTSSEEVDAHVREERGQWDR